MVSLVCYRAGDIVCYDKYVDLFMQYVCENIMWSYVHVCCIYTLSVSK